MSSGTAASVLRTSSGSGSTNSPTIVTKGGIAAAIAAAFAASTARAVPDQNTKPIASAPARAAASPSSTRVMPQILTRVRIVQAASVTSRRVGGRPNRAS